MYPKLIINLILFSMNAMSHFVIYDDVISVENSVHLVQYKYW